MGLLGYAGACADTDFLRQIAKHTYHLKDYAKYKQLRQ
jgi:hypothetical protein